MPAVAQLEPPSSLRFASDLAYSQDMNERPAQEIVTTSRILPAMPAILEHLRVHRASVDRDFEQERRAADLRGDTLVGGLPIAKYPVGYCRHIRDLVWARAWADSRFRALIGPGVDVRHVFVLLKGQYFQNAVQLGNLYIDVANDTVWVHKPKLEWARVSEVAYENLETWTRFADVAQRYLSVELYPNLLFPSAFPVAPFFTIKPNGEIGLLLAQDALFLKDLGEGMPRIEALLADDALMTRRLPAAHEALLVRTFGPGSALSFPLTFAPATTDDIRRGIVEQFIQLGRQPAERVRAAVDRYLRAIVAAARQLAQLKLTPA